MKRIQEKSQVKSSAKSRPLREARLAELAKTSLTSEEIGRTLAAESYDRTSQSTVSRELRRLRGTRRLRSSATPKTAARPRAAPPRVNLPTAEAVAEETNIAKLERWMSVADGEAMKLHSSGSDPAGLAKMLSLAADIEAQIHRQTPAPPPDVASFIGGRDVHTELLAKLMKLGPVACPRCGKYRDAEDEARAKKHDLPSSTTDSPDPESVVPPRATTPTVEPSKAPGPTAIAGSFVDPLGPAPPRAGFGARVRGGPFSI